MKKLYTIGSLILSTAATIGHSSNLSANAQKSSKNLKKLSVDTQVSSKQFKALSATAVAVITSAGKDNMLSSFDKKSLNQLSDGKLSTSVVAIIVPNESGVLTAYTAPGMKFDSSKSAKNILLTRDGKSISAASASKSSTKNAIKMKTTRSGKTFTSETKDEFKSLSSNNKTAWVTAV